MMTALAKILVTLFFVALLMWGAVGNSGVVDFSLPPVIGPLPVPVALLMLGAMILGFVWGAAVVWLNGAADRMENRRQRKEIKALEREISKKETSV